MNSADMDSAQLRCHVRGTSEVIGLIEVVGVLRLDTVPRLRKAVSKVLTDGPETIVLDLNGIEAVEDMLALVVFSTLGRLVADWAEGELILAAPHAPLREALERAAPLFVRVFATRAAAWHAAQHGACRRRVSAQLPATPAAPQRARRLVEDVCTRWQLGGTLRERAQRVVTELVINAAEHTSDSIELIITVRRYVLRLEVNNHPTALPHPPDSPSDALGSHGLHLVAHLASHWGSKPTTHGKTTWADLIINPTHRKTTTNQQPHHNEQLHQDRTAAPPHEPIRPGDGQGPDAPGEA